MLIESAAQQRQMSAPHGLLVLYQHLGGILQGKQKLSCSSFGNSQHAGNQVLVHDATHRLSGGDGHSEAEEGRGGNTTARDGLTPQRLVLQWGGVVQAPHRLRPPGLEDAGTIRLAVGSQDTEQH
jgi:hypothetical protein